MNYHEVKSRILAGRIEYPYFREEIEFVSKKHLPEHHKEVEESRLILLGAYQALISPVLKHHLKDLDRVLEVGSGTGFFSRYIAPEWLRENMVSFDINPYSVKKHQSVDSSSNLFVGSVYRLPVKTEAIDGVVGFSSFDSMLSLQRGINEARRVLKPGGKLVLFQDLLADLYEFGQDLTAEQRIERIEMYHQLLCEEVIKSGFEILEGEKEDLEGICIEELSDVKERCPYIELPDLDIPILIVWKMGYCTPLLRKADREKLGLKKTQSQRIIARAEMELFDSGFFDLFGAEAGDVVEMLRMRYLVLQKPQ